MDLVIVKLPSGEHLIGEVLSEEGNYITLQHVCNIYPKDDATVGVVPIYNMIKNGVVSIDRSILVYIARPSDDIQAQFEQAFGTQNQILVPDSKIIVQ